VNSISTSPNIETPSSFVKTRMHFMRRRKSVEGDPLPDCGADNGSYK
jgi:hypothetical protein